MWGRLLKGLMAIFSAQVIITLGNLLLVPLYLRYWPARLYGEWLALFSLVSYLATLDLGLNFAAGNRLIQAYARGDLEAYARCQHSALVFYLALALGGSGLLVVAAWTLPIQSWLGLQETPTLVAKWVVWLLGLQVLWAMPLGLIIGIYRTTGNLARSQWLANVRQILALGLVALILMLGGGMEMVALSQLVPLALISLYVIWDLKHRLPDLTPGLAQARFSAIRELVHPSLLFGLIMLATALTQQGPVIVVSSALGGVAVALFVTSRTLANVSYQLKGALTTAIWPDLTEMEALGEFSRLRSVHRLLIVATTTLCLAVAAALWFEGKEVITVWTRGKLEPDLTLLRLFLVLIVLQTPFQASGTCMSAANRHRKTAWLALISAVTGLGVAITLIGKMGTWAVPVGLIVGDALACYHFIIKDTCRMMGEPYAPFALRLWLGFAATATAALAAGWAAHETIPGPAVIRWAGVGLSTSVASLAVAWARWLTPGERALLMAKLSPAREPAGCKA